jgi:hypothetical protein
MAGGGVGGKDYVDIGGGTLITMSREGVSTDQQIVDAVRIQRSEQRLQIVQCRRPASRFAHDFVSPPGVPLHGPGSPVGVCSRRRET